MMRTLSICLALTLAGTATLAAAQTAAPAPAPATVTPVYSTAGTPVGTLIGDPAAKAVLDKHLPGLSTDPRLAQVMSMPLKAIQQFAPDQLPDAKLAAIDTDLAALPRPAAR